MEKTLKEKTIKAQDLIIKEMGVPFFNLYGKQIVSLMLDFEACIKKFEDQKRINS